MLNLKAFMTPEIRAAVLDARSTDRSSGFVPVGDFAGCDRVRVDPFPGKQEESGLTAPEDLRQAC